jgi:hypothetical protein
VISNKVFFQIIPLFHYEVFYILLIGAHSYWPMERKFIQKGQSWLGKISELAPPVFIRFKVEQRIGENLQKQRKFTKTPQIWIVWRDGVEGIFIWSLANGTGLPEIITKLTQCKTSRWSECITYNQLKQRVYHVDVHVHLMQTGHCTYTYILSISVHLTMYRRSMYLTFPPSFRF